MGTSSTLVNQPRTILGPLTTTFTPPISCGYINAPRTFPNGRIGWRGQSCERQSVNGMIDATQRWPPTTAGAAYPSTPFSGWGFYSPGLACPHGYTSACTATANGNAQLPVQFMMLDGETAVGCCPSGYTCFKLAAGVSCSLLTTSTVITMASCNSDDTMNPVMQTFPYLTVLTTTAEEPPTITTTTMIESFTAWAPMIQINWRSTDLATTPTSVPSSTTAPLNATTARDEKAGNEERCSFNSTLCLGMKVNPRFGHICYLRRKKIAGVLHELSWETVESHPNGLGLDSLRNWMLPVPSAQAVEIKAVVTRF
ncbi:hypothetical protein LA080_006546 [Diaporthe eres]|nr:hypothetical protein LA080_006546 [Diaporthe eres]